GSSRRSLIFHGPLSGGQVRLTPLGVVAGVLSFSMDHFPGVRSSFATRYARWTSSKRKRLSPRRATATPRVQTQPPGHKHKEIPRTYVRGILKKTQATTYFRLVDYHRPWRA